MIDGRGCFREKKKNHHQVNKEPAGSINNEVLTKSQNLPSSSISPGRVAPSDKEVEDFEKLNKEFSERVKHINSNPEITPSSSDNAFREKGKEKSTTDSLVTSTINDSKKRVALVQGERDLDLD